jgi:hypothetical protein
MAGLTLVGVGGTTSAGAAPLPPAAIPLSSGGPVLYDSTTSPLPANQPSEPIQSSQNSEFGNEIALAGAAPFTLNNAVVTLSSWGCETGGGTTCQTTPGATFNWPITLNIYNVGATDGTLGSLITSDTQTFAIPFRPSADNTDCTGGDWNAGTVASPDCEGGVANNVDFLLPTETPLPAKVIYGIAFDTTSYGPNPIGTPCTIANCPYDSLNVALTYAAAPSVGTDPFPGTVFQDSQTASQYCDVGTGGTGTFRLDSPAPDACWSLGASNGLPPFQIPAVRFNGVTVPDAPTIGAATPGNGSATVAFTPPSNSGGVPITSYTVTATDATNSANGGQTATGANSPITVTGLTNGDSYTFSVTATNDVGTGPPSSPTGAVVPAIAPGAPTIGTATAGNASASVSFTPPSSNGGSPILSYTVIATDSTNSANGGQTTTGSTSPITIGGLTNGDSYTFTVTATNAAATGPASAPSNAVVPLGVPSPPPTVVATAGNASASVSFGSPVTDGGSTVTSYTARASDVTNSAHGGQVVNGSGSPLSFTGLTNGDTYTFTVTATNAQGTSLSSAPSNAVVPTGTTPPITTSGSYDLVGSDGGVFAFGSSIFFGSLPGMGIHVNDIVGIVPTSDSEGYFLVGSDGGVFAFGDAPFENSLPGIGVHVNDIVGIVPTKDDKGYFLVGQDGGVFALGDAPFESSLPAEGIHVNNIVGIASTSDNGGYWLVSSTGTVYALGDAKNDGSASSGPIVSIAATPTGAGYWVTGANGSVAPFGDAVSNGSLPALGISVSDIVSLVPSNTGTGYLLIGRDGGVFAFGTAFPGSLPGIGIHVNNIVGAVPTS